MATTIDFGPALTLGERGGYLSGTLHLARFTEIIGGKREGVLVEIEPRYDDPDDDGSPALLPEAKRRAIEWLIANEEAVAKAVQVAMNAKLAEQTSGPSAHVDLRSVHFHDAVRGDAPYIGLLFGCSWDQEHGLGLMMNGTRLVSLGGADTAILEWIAREDARNGISGAEPKVAGGAQAKKPVGAIARKPRR